MLTSIWSRISRFSNEFLETRHDQDFRNKDIVMGKKQDVPYQDLANQEGNENIQIHEIKKIDKILHFSEISNLYTLFQSKLVKLT